MNLICLNELKDFDHFHSPLKQLFTLLSYRNDKDKLKDLLSDIREFQNMDEETAHVAGVFMGMEDVVIKQENAEGGKGNMLCKGLQELVEDRWNEGRNEGRNDIFNLQKKLVEEGRVNDLLKSIEDCEYRKQLLQEFGLMG